MSVQTELSQGEKERIISFGGIAVHRFAACLLVLIPPPPILLLNPHWYAEEAG